MKTNSWLMLFGGLLVVVIWASRQSSTSISDSGQQSTSAVPAQHASKSKRSLATPREHFEVSGSEEGPAVVQPMDLSGSPEEQLQKLLASEPTDECLERLTLIINSMTTEQRSKFLEIIEQAPPGGVAFHALGRLLTKWSETEPVAALDYVFKTPSGDPTRLDAAAEAARMYAAKDISAAFAYADGVENPENRRALIGQIAPVTVQVNAARTRDWIQHLPNNQQKETAFFTALQQLTEMNPAAAADWASSMIHESFLGTSTVGVCLMLANGDPGRAVEFLKYVPEGPGKDEASESIFSRWYLANPHAFSEYYLAMAPGRAKEIAGKAMLDMKAADGATATR